MSPSRYQSEPITAWRPAGFGQLELLRGVTMTPSIPRHSHEEYSLCLIEAGAGVLTYRGAEYPNLPGSLFIVSSGEVHANRSRGDRGYAFRTLYAAPALLQRAAAELQRSTVAPPFFSQPMIQDANLRKLFLALHRTLESAHEQLASESLLADFLLQLVAQQSEQPRALPAVGKERQAVKKVREYLEAHYAEAITLDELARMTNLSSFYLNRVFRAETGLPPHAYQTQLRVARAKKWLLQGCSVAETAMLTGFVDQSHLTRHFTRLVGFPPGRYARQCKNVQDSARPTR